MNESLDKKKRKINIALYFISILFFACDKEYNTIGVDLVNVRNYERKVYKAPVYSFQKQVSRIETSDLPIMRLGKVLDPIFGNYSASVVSQLELSSINPTFGESDNDSIKKVYLEIPFFSTQTGIDNENNPTYRVDSIFGNENVNFKLKVYELDYNLIALDPLTNFTRPKKYYNDENFLQERLGERLDKENDTLNLNLTEVLIRDENDSIISRLTPRIRIELDKSFFKKKIFDKEGQPELSNNILFKKHFKGIILTTNFENNDEFMMLADFRNAKIVINYTNGDNNSDFEIIFGGEMLNIIQNQPPNQEIVDEINQPNVPSKKIYLKGGVGYLSKILLFDNKNKTDTLQKIREKAQNWLIQEANLTFYIDTTKTIKNIANQIYLYKNNANNYIIRDYFGDNTFGKLIFGGLLIEGDGEPPRYKIRITEHINNILKAGEGIDSTNVDSTNVDLNLAVVSTINPVYLPIDKNDLPTIKLKETHFNDSIVESTPVAMSISPYQTILIGSNPNESFENKKIQLEIYYIDYSNN